MSTPQITWDAPKAQATPQIKWDEKPQPKKEGFLGAIGSDLKGVIASAFSPQHILENAATGGIPIMSSIRSLASIPENDKARKEQGRSATYRIAAPIAEMATGVNARGMEDAANKGDSAGVLGHAATPLALLAASEAIGRGVPAARNVEVPPVVGKVAKTGLEVGKAGAKLADVATFDRLGKGYNAIKNMAGNVGEIWAKPPVYPGAPLPEAPPVDVGAHLPATPAPEQLNPSLVSPARTLPGMHSPEVISVAKPQVAAPIPARQGLALPPARIAGPEVETALNDSLGGRPIQPSVSLKEQGLGVPKDFTPVKSSALKGYKYDAQAQEFHAMSKDGTVHIYGDVSPEQAQAFAENPSSGKAWQEIRNSSSPKVGKVVNGQRVANIPPKNLRSASPDTPTPEPKIADPNDLTSVLTRSVVEAKKKRATNAK